MRKIFFVCLGLFLLGCVHGEFSLPATAGKERESNAELVKQLESLNLEEVKSKAEQGDATAEVDLALMHILGVRVAQSFDEGISWLRKAEEKKDSTAIFNLGIASLKGVGGMDKDWIQAHMYMNIACTKAMKDGFTELANAACQIRNAIEEEWSFLVRSRRALAQDLALQYMNEKFGGYYVLMGPENLQAAKTGNKYAMFLIASQIHMGEGAPQHDITAYYWYTLGLSGGHRDATARRGMIMTRMSDEQIAQGDKMVAEIKPDSI